MNAKVQTEVKQLMERFNFSTIEEFTKQADWKYISKYQTLSKDFVREFRDKVYWTIISKNRQLSEDFIREFKDKVFWISIPRKQVVLISVDAGNILFSAANFLASFVN